MESKRLRREVARESAEYQRIKTKCAEYLTQKGFFKKAWILRDEGLEVFSDAIRWDYVVEWIQEEQDCELAPVADAFFKRAIIRETGQTLLPMVQSKKLSFSEIVEKLPGKFTASGHGKKTTGYANVTFANGALHYKRLTDRRALANALNNSSDKLEAQIDRVYSTPKAS